MGLTDGGGRRRVPGLRREEVAYLAGVSVDYYVRFEQGRTANVSDAVLDAVARALRLDGQEREHLFRLVRPPRAEQTAEDHVEARAGVHQLLDWIAAPALVIGHRMDILAWNQPATRLITDFGLLSSNARNLARLHLLDSPVRSNYPDQDFIVREIVGHLRYSAGRHPDDARLTELIAELRDNNADFRQEWDRQMVRSKSHGFKRFEHPTLGGLTLSYEIAYLTDDFDQMLLVYTAARGSREGQVLRGLWDAVEP